MGELNLFSDTKVLYRESNFATGLTFSEFQKKLSELSQQACFVRILITRQIRDVDRVPAWKVGRLIKFNNKTEEVTVEVYSASSNWNNDFVTCSYLNVEPTINQGEYWLDSLKANRIKCNTKQSSLLSRTAKTLE